MASSICLIIIKIHNSIDFYVCQVHFSYDIFLHLQTSCTYCNYIMDLSRASVTSLDAADFDRCFLEIIYTIMDVILPSGSTVDYVVQNNF